VSSAGTPLNKPPAKPVAPTTIFEAEQEQARPKTPTDGTVEREPPTPAERLSMPRELAALFAAMVRRRKGWPIIRLSVVILIVLIGNMVGQVRLNTWNGDFFDALEKRNTDAFLRQFIVFFEIIAVLLTLVVAQTWLQERLKVRIRERLSQILLDTWLAPGRSYRLAFLGERGAAPDQRMQEDCRLFSEFTTELGVGLIQSTLLLVKFMACCGHCPPMSCS
jgi:putative ATP-binding cassette transporter